MPSCHAVIFRATRNPADDGYAVMAARMEALARQQPGFLGLESFGDGPESLTVSYWSSLEAIAAWRAHPEHQEAQRLGRERWYAGYSLRVATVEAELHFPEPERG